MPTCPCGSDVFTIEFRTTAQVSIRHGRPDALTFGPIPTPGPFATATCAGCGTMLDLDDTLTGPGLHPAALARPGGPAVRPESRTDAATALAAARALASAWVPKMPSFTIRPKSESDPDGATVRVHRRRTSDQHT